MERENLVETIEYKGYNINILFDDMFDENPNEWDENVFLVYDHRQFNIEVDGFDPQTIFEHFQEGYKTFDNHWVFPVYAYIHSGVALSLGRDSYPFTDKWDVSFSGFILVNRKEYWSKEKAFERAQSEIEDWNYILSGQVFGYEIEDQNGNFVDSCWGFIGWWEDMLSEVKNDVNAYIKHKQKEKHEKLKTLVKNKVPFEKRTELLEVIE